MLELTREAPVIGRQTETGWPQTLAAAAVDLRYLERWLAWEGAAEKNPHAVALGRLGGKKGGKARATKLTPEERSEIARKAAKARWRNR